MSDGELVSVFGIIQLLFPKHLWQFTYYSNIDVLTLLLYLLVRCQIKLRSDSLHDTMNLICYVNEVLPVDRCLDRLILRLIYRLVILYTKTLTVL